MAAEIEAFLVVEVAEDVDVDVDVEVVIDIITIILRTL